MERVSFEARTSRENRTSFQWGYVSNFKGSGRFGKRKGGKCGSLGKDLIGMGVLGGWVDLPCRQQDLSPC